MLGGAGSNIFERGPLRCSWVAFKPKANVGQIRPVLPGSLGEDHAMFSPMFNHSAHRRSWILPLLIFWGHLFSIAPLMNRTVCSECVVERVRENEGLKWQWMQQSRGRLSGSYRGGLDLMASTALRLKLTSLKPAVKKLEENHWVKLFPSKVKTNRPNIDSLHNLLFFPSSLRLFPW